MIQDQETTESILSFFKNREYKMTQNNLKQTFVPEGAVILKNTCGTAPGILLNEEEGQVIVMLPGPPREMTRMFEEALLPILEKNSEQLVISRYYNLSNIGESEVEDRLLDLIDKQVNPTIATYAKIGEVLVRITANGTDEKALNELLDDHEKVMLDRLGEYIFAFSKDSLLETVCKLLIQKKISLATAESCTGGLISANLAEYPGISSVFGMGLVTYSNEVKMQLLGVKKETLEEFGAVSPETAKEMCEKLQEISKAMLSISVTGIAGPDGGTEEKPVGLVYIGICYAGDTTIHKFCFSGERKLVQVKTVNMVLHLVRKTIITKS